MNSKDILLYNDLKKEYQNCIKNCKAILRANCLDSNGFIFYRYLDFEYIFKIREEKKINSINIIFPSSREYINNPYEGIWISNTSILNIVASFALVYISDKVYLHTLPVWNQFLKRFIQLFKSIRVNEVRF